MEESPPLEEITAWSYDLGQHGFLYPRMIPGNEFYRIYYTSVHIVQEFNDEYRNLSADDKLTFICRGTIKLLYSDTDKENYKNLRDRILAFFEKWYKGTETEQVKQIFQAYESELYYPCLCGSVALVEKLLSDNNDPVTTSYHELISRKTDQLLQMTNDLREDAILKANVAGFVDLLSKRVPFSENEPFFLNRHWLLHGRVERKIYPEDCVGVFLLIDTLIELNEKIEVDSPCPTSPAS